jgi:hypothetical protein
MKFAYGVVVGGVITLALTSWLGPIPKTIVKAVNTRPEVCAALGGILEGDENGTLCILDNCTYPP